MHIVQILLPHSLQYLFPERTSSSHFSLVSYYYIFEATFTLDTNSASSLLNDRSSGMYSSSTHSATVDSLSHLPNYSSDTIITNAPGPGRTVGHLWGKVANWVEQKVLVVAHKQGLGLNVVKGRIDKCIDDHVKDECPWSLPDSEAKAIIDKIRPDCAKVGAYASCRSSPTERMALEYIMNLVTRYPFLRSMFNERDFGVHTKIEGVRDSDPNKITHEIWERRILSSRALLCFEDNEITKLVRKVESPSLTNTGRDVEEEKRKAIVKLLGAKKSRRVPEKQNVAIHFAGHLLSHARTCKKLTHIQPTEDFIINACRNAVDRLLNIKHSQFSVEKPLEQSCIALLEMIRQDGTPLPRSEGHPIRNMLTILESPSSKDMYPEACDKATELSQFKDEKYPNNDNNNNGYYSGPSFSYSYFDAGLPPRRSRRKRGRRSHAMA